MPIPAKASPVLGSISGARASSVGERLSFVTGAGASGPASIFTAYNEGDLAARTPVAGWGTALRNSAYEGPAIQVADNNDLANTKVDIFFSADGSVSYEDANLYGDDTRVIRLYDQWGSDDLVARDGYENNRLIAPAEGETTSFIGIRGAGFRSVNTAATAAWNTGNLAWSFGWRRNTGDNLSTLASIWGVFPTSGSYMGIGLWQEGRDYHWRVNGGPPNDWPGTNFVDNADIIVDKWSRLIASYANTSPANAYFNGALNHTKAYTTPINLAAGERLGLGDVNIIGISPTNCDFAELHLFSATTHLTDEEVAIIDAALAETH